MSAEHVIYFIVVSFGFIMILDSYIENNKIDDTKKVWEIYLPATDLLNFNHQNWHTFVIKLSSEIKILEPFDAEYRVGKWYEDHSFITHNKRYKSVRIVCNELDFKKIIAFSLTYFKDDNILGYELSNNIIELNHSKSEQNSK